MKIGSMPYDILTVFEVLVSKRMSVFSVSSVAIFLGDFIDLSILVVFL